MIRATNHVADAHIDVVDDDAQLIHGLAEFFLAFSGAQQDKVLDLFIRKLAFAEYRVDEFCCSTKRNFEADGRLHPGR